MLSSLTASKSISIQVIPNFAITHPTIRLDTAAYALGCSAGNFAGGQLLNWGVSAMLMAGIVMAFIGTVLVFAAVTKSDFS